jgi:hypothetical protein
MAILLTPLIYFIEGRMESYFGVELTQKMKLGAMTKV